MVLADKPTARRETLYLQGVCVCLMWIDWVTDSAEEKLVNPRCIFTHWSIAGNSYSLLCPSKCPKSWFKQESLTTIIISLSFHGTGIPPGLSRAILKQKKPLRQDFLSSQFAKGSQERSGRGWGGEAGAGREGNQDRVCRKLAAPDPLFTSGMLSSPDARGLSILTPHLHHWSFPTLDSRA